MSSEIDREVWIASSFTHVVREAQAYGNVGLDGTLADALAAGGAWVQLTGCDSDLGNMIQGYHYLRWHQGGVPRIRLSHGLAAQLALTDPNGIDVAEVRLPFPNFAIELPHPNGPLVIQGAGESRQQDVPSLYITSWAESDDMDFESLQQKDDDLRGWFSKLADSKSRCQWNKPRVHVMLKARGGIGVFGGMWLDRPIDLDLEAGGLLPLDECSKRATMMALRIIVNLALWLKAHDLGDTMSSAGRTVNHEHGLHSLFFEFGNEVKLDRSLRDAARAFCSSGQAHEKWTLEKRFIVRGHWKRQSFGEGRTQRRLIFVEPYWKGPANAPVLSRTYVDNPKD